MANRNDKTGTTPRLAGHKLLSAVAAAALCAGAGAAIAATPKNALVMAWNIWKTRQMALTEGIVSESASAAPREALA